MFLEDRILDCVSYGTEGGPSWYVRRVGLRSGIVRRNAMLSRPLYRFSVVYRNLLAVDHERVLAAFNATRAGVHGFRLKDWSDFEATAEVFAVGTGAPQSVQLIKTYTFGGQSVQRPIRKPLAGVVVTANLVTISAAINTTTGIATFTALAGQTIRWSGEFDVPVMFVNDRLSFSFEDRSNNEGFFLTADVDLDEDLST